MISMRRTPLSARAAGAVALTALLAVAGSAGSVARGADVLTLGSGSGNAGSTGVEVPLSATHDQAMQGFSISASFNSSLLTMTGITFDGTDTAIIAPGGVPAFVGLTIDNVAGTVIGGVIFGFDPVPPLNQIPQLPASPTEADVLAKLVFDISPSALPVSIPIDLVNGLGSPAIDNVFSNDGVSFSPQLVDGSISVNNLHRLYFDPMLAVPGGALTALVRYDNEDPMNAFVLSFSWDSAKLALQQPATNEGWWEGTDLDVYLGAQTIEYFDKKTTPAFPQPGVGYLALITIFDFVPPFAAQQVPVGTHHSLIRLNFNVANNPGLIGVTTIIKYENTISPAPPPPSPGNPNPAIPPPTANLVVNTDLQGITPVQENGIVQIVNQPSFVRGNANSDSSVNLADAIFTLQFLFSSGNPPQCGDAADPNDDGGVDVSDAIYLIGYLFSDGPPPEPPFSQTAPFGGCGLDATPDILPPSFMDCITSVGPCP
jgi:hypothetical protein